MTNIETIMNEIADFNARKKAAIEILERETLALEIALAVAQDAFDAKRARLENGYAEAQGWKKPLRPGQFRAMNRMIDADMNASAEGRALTAAASALRANKVKRQSAHNGYF